jgi:hypothetical protein
MASPLLTGIFLHARKKSRMRPAGSIPVPFGKGGGKSRFLPYPAWEKGRGAASGYHPVERLGYELG